MFWFIGIVSWVLCGCVTYRLLRQDWRLKFNEWTTDPRRLALVISAFGPIGLIASVIIAIRRRVDRLGDKPAKW